jgi:hypothetical protein
LAECSDGSDPASIGLDPGETVTCDFYNGRKPKVKLRKEFVPSTDPGEVSFTIGTYPVTEPYGHGDETDWYMFDIDATASFSEAGYGGLVLGAYESSWSCTDGSSGTGTMGMTNALPVGAEVVCTFVNEYILVDQTAFGQGSPYDQCFFEVEYDGSVISFDNWGWTNGPILFGDVDGQTLTWPMHVGASDCIGTPANYVGDALVSFGGGTVSVVFDETTFPEGVLLDESSVHVHADTAPFPQRGNSGKFSNSPGQYEIGTGFGLTDEIYVIVHAVFLVPEGY